MFTHLRFIKNDCIEALQAEYVRLGEPLSSVELSPSEAVAQVVAHLGSETAVPDSGDGAGEEGPDGEDLEEGDGAAAAVSYAVIVEEGAWMLQAYSGGTLVCQAALPDPSEDDGCGYYQLVCQDGEWYAWAGGTTTAVRCSDHLEQNAAAASAAASIAARPAHMSGMGGRGRVCLAAWPCFFCMASHS